MPRARNHVAAGSSSGPGFSSRQPRPPSADTAACSDELPRGRTEPWFGRPILGLRAHVAAGVELKRDGIPDT
jgi:hypothetical protein